MLEEVEDLDNIKSFKVKIKLKKGSYEMKRNYIAQIKMKDIQEIL